MNSTNKRVRFEAPTSARTGSPSTMINAVNQSPKGCAISSIRTFSMTLRKHLSPIVQKAGETHIDLLHKLMSKNTQLNKMDDDDDFIPRSARLVNFEFRVTKKVENHPEFRVIKTDTDTLVHEFRLALKQKIAETLRIECSILRAELYENFITSLHLVTQAHLIAEQKSLNPHKVISTIFHNYYEEMFVHTDLTQQDFYNGYKKIHGLATFPIPLHAVPAQADEEQMADAPETPLIPQDIAQQAAIRQRDDAISSKALLLATFTRPGKAYFARLEEIEIDISLKKLHSTTTLEDATDATKTRLDVENSVDKDLLDDIIRQEVAAKTKKFTSELGQLKRHVSQLTRNKNPPPNQPRSIVAKNTRRGPPTTRGASAKKQDTTPTQPSSTRRKKKSQPAAARARDTSEKSQRKKNASEKQKKKNRNQN